MEILQPTIIVNSAIYTSAFCLYMVTLLCCHFLPLCTIHHLCVLLLPLVLPQALPLFYNTADLMRLVGYVVLLCLPHDSDVKLFM
jgi:hypothetical protein